MMFISVLGDGRMEKFDWDHNVRCILNEIGSIAHQHDRHPMSLIFWWLACFGPATLCDHKPPLYLYTCHINKYHFVSVILHSIDIRQHLLVIMCRIQTKILRQTEDFVVHRVVQRMRIAFLEVCATAASDKQCITGECNALFYCPKIKRKKSVLFSVEERKISNESEWKRTSEK